MSDSHSKMAKSLADTVSASSPNSLNNGTYSIGGTYANTTITNNGVLSGGAYTVGTGVTQPWFSNSAAPKIQLNGEGADIEVNGKSLMNLLEQIEERLNILTINPNLEAEWNELKVLGDQYRKLEQHIKDKQATWNRLTAT